MHLQPCAWSIGKPLYEAYHAKEWGKPSYDERHLFEMLCLEGQQAGLSWYTVLVKRAAYRQAFAHFDPAIVSTFKFRELEACLNNAGLIRHAKKLAAIVHNACILQGLKGQGIDMVEWLWQGVPVQVNHWQTLAEVPSSTSASVLLAKRLKAQGFQFVGPTICYSFMQAVGMVHDHLVNCPEHVKNIMESTE